eukprot:15454003-Alexandrium_andersonii.AAC.1
MARIGPVSTAELDTAAVQALPKGRAVLPTGLESAKSWRTPLSAPGPRGCRAKRGAPSTEPH